MDEIFNIYKGKRLTKADMIDGRLNYIGAISENNGVRQQIEAAKQFDGNCITVNYNGSVGEAFYQDQPFWASDDVNILTLKNHELNEAIALYMITIIKANQYRFGYGRKWTLEKMAETEISLSIDDTDKPDWDNMEKYICGIRSKHIQSKIVNRSMPIDKQTWKEFRLSDLFKISVSKDANLQNSNIGKTPYVSSSSVNNGVCAYIDASPSQKNNTITIARNGSVGSAFYQPAPYCASPDDIRILKPHFAMSVYSALFITTVIEKEKFRYAYGRKLGTKRIMNIIVKLPAKSDGTPDFGYMENYIKSLPYSDRIAEQAAKLEM